MKMKIFEPIESMNPIYLGAAGDELYAQILREHNGNTLGEIKEDGYRMQVHKKGKTVKGFTRSKNAYALELFPELAKSLQRLPDCIIDAELIGDHKIGHDGFDVVKRRFRSKATEKVVEECLKSGMPKKMPLALRVFDTLYWEGKPVIDLPLTERRKYTELIDERKITPSMQMLVTSSEELKGWFESLVSKNYEGLVCKNPGSAYVPGSRTSDWIKLKRSECLDLAVLGVYLDKGEISQLLCGTYNPASGKFETLAKVNAKRNGMNSELEGMLRQNFVERCPERVYVNPGIEKAGQVPDYFVQPDKTCVVEVAAMNFHRGKNWHSCGLEDGNSYSLRIGWLKAIREDKDYKQAATTEQVKLLYQQEREEK